MSDTTFATPDLASFSGVDELGLEVTGQRLEPDCAARRTLLTGTDVLTDRHNKRLARLIRDQRHLPVEVTWNIYQDTITAYRNPDPVSEKAAMARLINQIAAGVPAGLSEVARLGRTLRKRAADILA